MFNFRNYYIFSLKINFVLSNSEDPDEILCYVYIDGNPI